jgi:hypothetical protein
MALGVTATFAIPGVVPSVPDVTTATPDPATERVLIVLADISGYTDFMLANQLALVHGQQLITSLIEALIAEVEIPLELQEIEGDALFLYARHPGDDAGWSKTCSDVARKLPRFFETFADRLVRERESTMCRCGTCQNADRLKLKVIVHSGEALFHRIDRFQNLSGVDVILAHRLLKNSVASDEYLLMTDAARRDLPLPDTQEFASGKESYEGFGEITTWVHHLSDPRVEARERLFEGSAAGLAGRAVVRNLGAVLGQFPALMRSGELARRHGKVASAGRRWSTGLLFALLLPLELLAVLILTAGHILLRRRKAHRPSP